MAAAVGSRASAQMVLCMPVLCCHDTFVCWRQAMGGSKVRRACARESARCDVRRQGLCRQDTAACLQAACLPYAA
jgi:hypothetical protein